MLSKLLKRKEIWLECKPVRTARRDCYMSVCECGMRYHTRNWLGRLEHWWSCELGRSVRKDVASTTGIGVARGN